MPAAGHNHQQRTCPGEKYPISPAICRTRQRNQYPKCLLCQHRSAELAGAATTDPKVPQGVFRTSGVIGHVPGDVNEYVLRKVGLAAGQLLRAEMPTGQRLVVACDLRENSRSFARIFSEGVNRAGLDTVNIGPATPELLLYMLGTESYTGAGFVSGGDYAPDVNGVRLWRGSGQPLIVGTGLEKVGLIARRMRTARSRLPGETHTASPLGDHVAYCRKALGKLRPMSVVADAGNGAAGRVLEHLFVDTPVKVKAMHLEEDGHSPFLGRRFPSNSLTAAMRGAVQDADAEFGVAFDFTGERAAFFDEKGALLGYDVAAGVIAAEVLERTEGAAIAYDLRSTAALGAMVRSAGGEALPLPTSSIEFGERFRNSEAAYGADLTGLHYFADFFRSPSPTMALLTFCSRVSEAHKRVSDLCAPLEKLSHSGEIEIAAASPEAAAGALEVVREEFAEADTDDIDGLTVRLRDYWFNLRQPGEAGELRLNVEGRTSRDQRKGRQTVERMVQKALSGSR